MRVVRKSDTRSASVSRAKLLAAFYKRLKNLDKYFSNSLTDKFELIWQHVKPKKQLTPEEWTELRNMLYNILEERYS